MLIFGFLLFYVCLNMCIVLNTEVTDLKTCLQKQELQLDSKVHELKGTLCKVHNHVITNKYC